MVTDTNFLDDYFSFGVGQYQANWDKIEAEWYMTVYNIDKIEDKNSSNGFITKLTSSSGFLKFPNVNGLSTINAITCSVSATKGGEIEIRKGSEQGELLGKITIPNKTNSFKEFTTTLPKLEDKMDLHLVFKGQNNSKVALDWFRFK
jgi:hypothetical protein